MSQSRIWRSICLNSKASLIGTEEKRLKMYFQASADVALHSHLPASANPTVV